MPVDAAAAGRSRRPPEDVRGWEERLARAAGGVAVLLGLFGLEACSESPVAPQREPLTDLPADLAAVTLTASGTLSAPYVMLELGVSDGFSGYVAVNEAGRPVWFYRTEGTPFGFARRSNGDFVFLDRGAGLVEVTPAARVVHRLAQEEPRGRFIHHDVVVTPRNTVLFLASDWRESGGRTINGAAVWEWDPERGTAVRRWSAFDALDPAVDRGTRSLDGDWLHENSLNVGPHGNVVVSFNFLNQVISLSPDFQRIEWRLGGPEATYAVADAFSGQHTAQEIAPGRVLLFDNGFERPAPGYSRAAEYELSGGAARIIWQWRPEPDNWARVISSARRLPNGNTLVAFGVPKDQPPGSTGPIEVFEVTPAGRATWHLTVSGRVGFMYRATPLFGF